MQKHCCANCYQVKPIWKNDRGNRFCKACWLKISSTTKAIPKRSPKKIKLDYNYSKVRMNFLSQHPLCQAKIYGLCTNTATEIHHKKGREGELLINPEFFLSVCRQCHEWIENNPNLSKDLGFSISRIIK